MATTESSPNTALDLVLQCTKCNDRVKNPHTLLECLHSYCKQCLDGIRRSEEETQLGYVCIACSSYTQEENLRHNSFLADLIEVSKEKDESNAKQDKTCMQCLKKEKLSTGKCTECKLQLCDDCCFSHLQIPMLKDHKITVLQDDSERVIDKLIFCRLHESKLLEYNCKTCAEMICAMCNLSDHNTHITETIDQGLDRLKPEIESNCASIKLNIDVLKAQIASIAQEIENTKESYSYCRLQMDERLEVVINRLKAAKAEMEEEVNEQETIALDILKNIKSNLENKLSLARNLTSVVEVTTDKARHISLLYEMQFGLCKKVKERFKTQKESFEFEIKTPSLKVSLDENVKQLIADLRFEERVCTVDSLGVIWTENEFICDDLNKVFKQPLTRDLEIDVNVTWANRLSYFDKKLWLPTQNGRNSKTLVYDNCGTVLNTILDDQGISVVRKANNGDVIAGGSEGLFLTDNNCSQWTKLADGEYSDIFVHGMKFSVCERNKSLIKTFVLRKCDESNKIKWFEELSFKVEMELNDNTTFLTKDSEYIVCNDNVVCHLSNKGDIIHENNNLERAVCGIDKYGKIAICDYVSGLIYLLDRENIKSISAKLSCNTKYTGSNLRDFVVDNECNVWYLEDNNEKRKLVKYKVV